MPGPSLRRIPMVRLADIDPDQPGMCEHFEAPDFEAMSARFVEGRQVPDYEGIIRSMSE